MADIEAMSGPVFKTGRASQPGAWMVRLHRRSVGKRTAAVQSFLPATWHRRCKSIRSFKLP